ncbi:MAG: TlpA disulfide reductase family protein [Actinomycetota bacterium]|nr:TlpA disulfide reductase family protein [Actinomycetota bacterium]
MSTRTPSSTSSGPPWVLIGVVAVVAAAAIMATVIAVTGGDSSAPPEYAEAPGEPGQIASVAVDGDVLPPHPGNGGEDVAVTQGLTAPPVRGQNFEGESMTITPGDGTPKMMVFLAHWCPHCQDEVPVIQDWLDDGNLPDGVEMVAVSTAVGRVSGNYPPSEWLEGEGWTVPTMVDQNEGDGSAGLVARAYGLSGFPYFVAVDGNGTVVFRGSGELSQEELSSLAGALAAGGSDEDLSDIESDESTELDEDGNPVTSTTAAPE